MTRLLCFALLAIALPIGAQTDPASGTDDRGVAAAAQESDETRGRAQPRRVDEVVVTGRRRAELLEDTPISITAINNETLVGAGVSNLGDIQYLVPNLRIDTGREGSGGGTLRIRGVGPTESGNPGVGTYIDGVFLQSGGGQILSILDVEQVEVLRGPQGTLFGKNTLGGAVNFKTVKPHAGFDASTWLSVGSYDTVETRTMLNVPVTFGGLDDKVFTRWTFASKNTGGHTRNLATGERHDDRDALWGLGKLRLLPTDDLEININGNYFQQHRNGAGGRCFAVPGAGELRGIITVPNPDFFAKCRDTDNYEFRTSQQMLYRTQNYGLWGNITYTLGSFGFVDELQLRLLGAWRENESIVHEDVDLTDDPVILLTNIGTAGVEAEPSETTATNVEGQVVGSAFDGAVDVVGGVFASWQDNSLANIVRTNPPALDRLGGFTLGPVERDENDWAIYGQATWDVFDWASLTGGIRYTSETRAVSRRTIFPAGAFVDGVLVPGPVETSSGSDEKTFTQWTPMGSLQLFMPDPWLDHTPIDDLMGYFTYSQGFSSGGFNAVVGSTGSSGGLVSFDPATLDNYEVGLKTQAFDHRVRLSISLFYMDYDDIQVTQSRTINVPGQPLPEFIRLIVNATQATQKGIEAELMARPTDRLLLMGNIGVNETRFRDFIDISGFDGNTEFNRRGETFSNTPKFTSYIAAEYTFDIDSDVGWLDGTLTPRIDWYYTTKIHNAPPEDPSGLVPGYDLLNARLAYEFHDDRLMVALWGRNLTDSEYFYSGPGTTGTYGYNTRYYQQRLSIGAEFGYRF